MEDKKVCRVCGQEKALTEFFFSRKDCLQYRGDCKSCFLETRKEYKLKNVEKYKKYKRKYRELHREQINERKRQLYYTNPNKTERNSKYDNSLSKKRWREKNSELIKKRCKQSRDSLSDCYVRERITYKTNLKTKDIPQSLVEVYRLQIQLKREMRKLKEAENGSGTGNKDGRGFEVDSGRRDNQDKGRENNPGESQCYH